VPKVKYHLTHKMSNKLHNYPVKLHLRRICHISFTKWQLRFTVTLSDKYASCEASQDNCEADLSFCESIDTLPRTFLQWASGKFIKSHRLWTLKFEFFRTAYIKYILKELFCFFSVYLLLINNFNGVHVCVFFYYSEAGTMLNPEVGIVPARSNG
jgi:hypothetical protein